LGKSNSKGIQHQILEVCCVLIVFGSERKPHFMLSRQAALLSPRTIEFYERTVGEYISFVSERGI
jgi:hypothetical protein